MYSVTKKHFRPCYVKGDLDSEMVIVSVTNFKTRTEAKGFIERELRGKKNVDRDYHKGDEASYCEWWTGKTWVEENTGEERSEYYEYCMRKLKV